MSWLTIYLAGLFLTFWASYIEDGIRHTSTNQFTAIVSSLAVAVAWPILWTTRIFMALGKAAS